MGIKLPACCDFVCQSLRRVWSWLVKSWVGVDAYLQSTFLLLKSSLSQSIQACLGEKDGQVPRGDMGIACALCLLKR